MIKDNSLGDRLNAVKKGKPLPSPTQPMLSPQYQTQQKLTLKNFLISKGINMLDMFLASFLYGFAIKTIFSLEWSIFASFAVGFLFNHAISIFPRILFPKLFK